MSLKSDERSSKGCRNHRYYLSLLSIIAYFDFKVHHKGLTICRGNLSEGNFLRRKICFQYTLYGIADLQNLTRKVYSFTKYFLWVLHNKSIHFLESIIKLRKTVAVICLFDLMYTYEVFLKNIPQSSSSISAEITRGSGSFSPPENKQQKSFMFIFMLKTILMFLHKTTLAKSFSAFASHVWRTKYGI